MENYNKYNESLNIDCGCGNTTPKVKKVKDDCCCGGINLPSHDNKIEVLIRQLKREVKELIKSTDKRLLCQDKKIAETMVYIKNNLSNAIRNLLDSMLVSGELDDIITDVISDEINTKITYVNNINSMKAFDFEVGDCVATLGYYKSNDGGNSTYKIVNDSNLVDNGGTIIRLNNGLYAILIIDDEYNVKQFGAKGDNETDDTLAFKNIINTVKDGDKIYIPNGKYLLSEEIVINKTITIYGSGTLGSEIIFNSCNGFILNKNFISIKDINITGINKINNSLIDINNKEFGYIAIKFEYTDDISNGGCDVESVKIRDFNTGVAIYSSMTQNKWSGCYRNFNKLDIRNCDIGIIALDGATYNSFINSVINKNNLNGIYLDTDSGYQNLEMINTSIENNGDTPDYQSTVTENFGIYVGANSKLKLTNCYLENEGVYVCDMGNISLVNTHVQHNAKCFGIGTITSVSSHSDFENKQTFSVDLASRCTNTGLTITQLQSAVGGNAIRVQSNNNGNNTLTFPTLYPISTPVKDIEWIKFEFDVKLTSGYDINNFGLKLISRLTSGNSGVDSMNVGINYPVEKLIPKENEYQHYTIFYRPRKGGNYLKENTNLYSLAFNLVFNKTLSSNASDFSINNLDMELANPVVTLYSRVNDGYNADMIYLKSLIS